MRVLLTRSRSASAGRSRRWRREHDRLSEHRARSNRHIANYRDAPTDAVARLQKAIDAGETSLEFDEAHGYLPALLSALKVPVSSQGLVFSRTSLQVDHIAPWSPRAIYFSDDVYVGWVQGGPIMEIATVDPHLGAVFYTVDQETRDKPVITRQTRTCLQCHRRSPPAAFPASSCARRSSIGTATRCRRTLA